MEMGTWYPVHGQLSGPVETYGIQTRTDDLSGHDLDFFYAGATRRYDRVMLNFLPGERLEGVVVSTPTGFQRFTRDVDVDEMKNQVKEVFGEMVEILRIRKAK